MNCLYITLFFNTVAGIVQTFIKSWYQILYSRVVGVFRLPFEPCHDFFLHLIIVISPSFREFTAPSCHILPIHNVTINTRICLWISTGRSFLRWEIVWRNAPRSWRDFGSALPFQTRLTQIKLILPLSNEQSSQVKNHGRRQCCHNKQKNFPIGPHVMNLYFPDRPSNKVERVLWFSLQTVWNILRTERDEIKNV